MSAHAPPHTPTHTNDDATEWFHLVSLRSHSCALLAHHQLQTVHSLAAYVACKHQVLSLQATLRLWLVVPHIEQRKCLPWSTALVVCYFPASAVPIETPAHLLPCAVIVQTAFVDASWPCDAWHQHAAVTAPPIPNTAGYRVSSSEGQ